VALRQKDDTFSDRESWEISCDESALFAVIAQTSVCRFQAGSAAAQQGESTRKDCIGRFVITSPEGPIDI
jgi:hypothetical protein